MLLYCITSKDKDKWLFKMFYKSVRKWCPLISFDISGPFHLLHSTVVRITDSVQLLFYINFWYHLIDALEHIDSCILDVLLLTILLINLIYFPTKLFRYSFKALPKILSWILCMFTFGLVTHVYLAWYSLRNALAVSQSVWVWNTASLSPKDSHCDLAAAWVTSVDLP